MKKYRNLLLIVVLFVLSSCAEKIDIKQEKEAIIAVIEKETNAYINKNYSEFASTHVQDETNTRLTAEKNGYDLKTGWLETARVMQEMFIESPEPWTSRSIKTNHRIKVYENSAWAMHDESWIDQEGNEFMKNVGVRFLEKVNGEWKIVYVSYVNTTSYQDNAEQAHAVE